MAAAAAAAGGMQGIADATDLDEALDVQFDEDAMTAEELADKAIFDASNPGMQSFIIVMHAFDRSLHYHLEAIPKCRRANFYIETVGINFLILIASISVIAQTYCPMRFGGDSQICLDPHYDPDRLILGAKMVDIWHAVDQSCFVVFALECLFRFLGSIYIGNFRRYISGIMNWIDIIAVAPFFIEHLFAEKRHPNLLSRLDTRFIRALRMARITSSLKTMRFGNMNQIIANIINTSLGALTIPIYFMSLALIVVSIVMFFIEGGKWYCCSYQTLWSATAYETKKFDFDMDCESTKLIEACGLPTEICLDERPAAEVAGTKDSGVTVCMATETKARFKLTYDGAPVSGYFEDVSESMWWCIVTFTTVGYGDKSATTPVGMLLNSFAMFLGIFFLAMPVAIIGDAFQFAWKDMQSTRRAADAKRRLIKGDWQPDLKKLAQMRMDMNTHIRFIKSTIDKFRAAKSELEKRAWDKSLDELHFFQGEFSNVWATYNVDTELLKEQMAHKL
eukprot:SAG31_NODE_6586_length_1962_cov_1.273215_1_plen_505_part_10